MSTIAGNPHALPHYYSLRTNTTPAKVILWIVAVSNALLATLYFVVALYEVPRMGSDPTTLFMTPLLVAWGGFWTWLAVLGIRKIDQLRAECFEACGLQKPE